MSSSLLEDMRAQFQLARDLEKSDQNGKKAIEQYRLVIFSSTGSEEEEEKKKKKKTTTEMNEETKIKEQAIDAVSRVYAKNNDANAIKLLVDELKPLFEQMRKRRRRRL